MIPLKGDFDRGLALSRGAEQSADSSLLFFIDLHLQLPPDIAGIEDSMDFKEFVILPSIRVQYNINLVLKLNKINDLIEKVGNINFVILQRGPGHVQ